MAERRMFARTIIDSDTFVDMPFSAQALYVHLCMIADDEGFVNNPKRIMRSVGASDSDMQSLENNSYIIPFPSGVVVITHWKVHNYIQKDRYKETQCTEEKRLLQVQENKEYSIVDTACIHNGYNSDTQVREEKGREEKGSTGEGEERDNTPTRRAYGLYNNVFLTDEEHDALVTDIPDAVNVIDKLSMHMKSSGRTYTSHEATVRKWAREDAERKQNAPTYGGDWTSTTNRTPYSGAYEHIIPELLED